jgi:hypothetical protein
MLDVHNIEDTDIIAPPAADELRKRPDEWDDLLFQAIAADLERATRRVDFTFAAIVVLMRQISGERPNLHR